MCFRSFGRSTGLLLLALSASFASGSVAAQSLATYELSVEVGPNVVQLDIYDAITGQRLGGRIIEPTAANPDARYSTYGTPTPGDSVLNGDLFVLAFTPVACGALTACTPLAQAIKYAWSGDREGLTIGSFYFPYLPPEFYQVGQNTSFTLVGGALDVRMVDASISGTINATLGERGWTLPYDLKYLCAAVPCAGYGPDEWFLSAGVSTVTVTNPDWNAVGQRLVPTFQFKDSFTPPQTWFNLTWVVPGLTVQFAPGATLGVDGTTFNVVGATLTASAPTSGWGGVRFNPYSNGTWANGTTVQRVAGDTEGAQTNAAAISVNGASPTFDGVFLELPVPGTYLHGLYVTGLNSQTVATNLIVTGMTGRGVLVNGGARLDLLRGVISANNGAGIVASGTGTRAYLQRALTGDLRGPQVSGNSGGVWAMASAEVRFGTSNASAPGYGYASVTRNLGGRGLSATTGGDIYAGSGTVASGAYQRNQVFGNFPSNSGGNAFATGTGSSVYARCAWWNTADPNAFRVGSASGALLDASYYLTADPYQVTNPTCTNLIIDGRAGSGTAWTTQGGVTAGRGTPEAEADGLDRLAEAMSAPISLEAVSLLASLVADLPETEAASAALGEAGVIAGQPGAPASAGALLDAATTSGHGALRVAAWQGLVSVRRATGDLTGALDAAGALAAEGGAAVVQADLARVYLYAEAADTTAALGALASLETLAPGTVELELARAVLGSVAPLGARGASTPVVTARGKTESSEDTALSLSVGPNPAASSAVVVLTLAEPADVTVTVYDLLGRAVATPLAGVLPAGAHRSSIDASALAPGVYVVRVTAGGSGADQGAGPVVQTLRLTVAR